MRRFVLIDSTTGLAGNRTLNAGPETFGLERAPLEALPPTIARDLESWCHLME